ncbi:MAG: DUF748 domain-containing protein [Methylococcales bacterium]|nr:DUF748 domain-containing protein [Methylococcales bacterium]
MAINKKYWMVAAVLISIMAVYALSGFYLLPAVLHSKLPALLSEKTGQQFSLQAVSFNPFKFKLALQGFAANSPQGDKLLGFEALHIDFDAYASLKELALVFDEITLLKPQVDVQRLADGRFNLGSLIPPKSADTPDKTDRPAPPLTLRHISIRDGQLNWLDMQHARPQSESLNDVNFSLTNLNTQSRAAAALELGLAFASGGSLRWQGDLQLQPISSKGHLNIETLSLPKIRQLFLADNLPVDIAGGNLSLYGDYQAELAASVPGVQITNAGLELKQLEVANPNSHDSLLAIPSVVVSGMTADSGKRRLDIGKIVSNDARISATLQQDGHLNYQALFAGQTDAAPAAAQAPAAAGPNWQISLAELALKNYTLNFSDQSRKTPQLQQLTAIDINLRQITSPPTTKSPLQFSALLNNAGKIRMTGDIGLSQASAALDIDIGGVKLKPFQDYLNDYLVLELVEGELNTRGHLQLQAKDALQLAFQGDAGLGNLITRDKLSNKDFVKWNNLTLQQIDASLAEQNFSFGKVLFERPYLRLTIRKDHSTSINDILVKPSTGKATVKSAARVDADHPANPPVINIGKIEIRNGHSDFADRSLILPFEADMDNLDGDIDGFSSKQNKSVHLDLQGKVYNVAHVVIKGSYQPSSGNSDINLKFTHMPLPLITPYMADFAGYKIEKGQMALDLHYTINQGQLDAQNKIFIDQLTLGDKVDNPHATSLPLRLAIALLKDSDGKINLDFPITGSLNDPQFSIGSLISDVLINLIDKLVTSPFKALGGLFDTEQDPGSIDFIAGKTAFKPGETGKLDQLVKALQNKPELTVDIKGEAYQALDWPEMRFEALTDILKKMKSGELRDKGEKLRSEYIELSDDEYKRLLAKFFQEVFPGDIEFGLLGAPHIKSQPDADFYAVARQKLESAMQPDPQRLTALAVARANAISGYLAEKGGLDQNRIFILAPEVNTGNSSKIASILSLNAAQ